jgi:hypothetical protein
VYLHGSDQYDFTSWAEAALLAGESVLTFAFAAVALEAAGGPCTSPESSYDP